MFLLKEAMMAEQEENELKVIVTLFEVGKEVPTEEVF